MAAFTRKIALVFLDILVINAAVYFSLVFRFDGPVPVRYLNLFLHSSILLTMANIAIYYIFGLYRSLWRYAGTGEIMQVFLATAAGTGFSWLFGWAFSMMYPRSVYIVSWLLIFVMISACRLSYRIARRLKRYTTRKEYPDKKRVMIIGAGEAGSMVIRELRDHDELKAEPVVAVDDDRAKHRSRINGVPVEGGRERIKELAEKYRVDEIIVAIPSARKREISDILNICKETRCRLKTLPGVYEIINERVSVKHIRDVSIEDLLGRDEVRLDTEEIAGFLKNETVLVTGGGGSIGSELCRQIARFGPKKILIFDIYENNAYELKNELDFTYKNAIDTEVLIGSVRDTARLKQVFAQYRPGVVFHAAAHKHVPLMELNPSEAVKNNVLGTLYTAQCADEYGTRKFVLVSTDKAVNPTNIMGATKRLAELIVQSMDRQSKTEFSAVRFGNVLGSSGSVIPLFKKQIAHGGPVTVTHPNITRYFMTIPEAAQLVIQAGAMAQGGEIFILDMGEPVKIVDLARDLIKLSGFEPDEDIEIVFTGIRPGEKLYEELLLEEEGIRRTAHEKIFIGRPLDITFNEVLMYVRALENSMDDPDELRMCMAKILPTYRCAYGEPAAAKTR